MCSEFGTTGASRRRKVKFQIRNMAGDKNRVGVALRLLRKAKGLTQPNVVARLQLQGWGITRESYAKIESQFRCVTDIELMELSAALGVPAQDLLPQAKPKSRRKSR